MGLRPTKGDEDAVRKVGLAGESKAPAPRLLPVRQALSPANRRLQRSVRNGRSSAPWRSRRGIILIAMYACRLFLLAAAPAFLGAAEKTASVYFQPKLQAGQKLGNIFSRATSYSADGMDEVVRRVSGTAVYVVTENSAQSLALNCEIRYDGKPVYKAKTEMKDRGRTICYDGSCSTNTDASGLFYNPLLWGDPKGTIRKGMSWTVSIADPWELGPPGEQTVTVIETDPANHALTLKREGAGEGFFAGDHKQIQVSKGGQNYQVDVSPGRSHWVGYTRFREGIVISDELLVERPVILSSKDLVNLPAQERQYILLNATPSS
jgi:hypothetical protein